MSSGGQAAAGDAGGPAGAVYERMDDAVLCPKLTTVLANDCVVGWFQGRMEFGPRALGGRSIVGDPIVCTPEDAYRCFMRTEMDNLVIENYVLAKPDQPPWAKDDFWQDEFDLD